MKKQVRLKISEEVRLYLKKKNQDTISITISTSGGGCCPTIETMDISLACPKNKENYQKYTEDGVNVYISNNAKILAPVVKIDLKSSLLKSKITVAGISLKTHDM